MRQDLTGKRYGRLTVLEYDKSQSKWKCQCDCGGIAYANTGHLNSGSVSSCGCMAKERQPDLAGKRFGRLIVLEKTGKRKGGSVLWECLCDCGNICDKPTGQLTSGFATSCGCAWRQPVVKENDRFGKLIVIQSTGKRSSKSIIWECRCDCGNSINVRATSLTSGHTTSCGCAKAEIDADRDFKEVLTYTDDTCIQFAEKIGKPTTNTSSDTGVRGVILKDGKYVAQLTFRKQRYYLGRYARLEDAIRARKQAEERIVGEYLDAYYASEKQKEGDTDESGN